MMLFLAINREKDGDASRQRILAAIQAEPGIHAADLEERVELAWSTISYHARVLEKRGLISTEKSNREKRLFPTTIPATQHTWFAALRDDDTNSVLKRILTTEDQGLPELSADLGLPQKVMRRHLSTLKDAGLVDRTQTPKPLYFGTPDAEKALSEHLRNAMESRLDRPENPSEPDAP